MGYANIKINKKYYHTLDKLSKYAGADTMQRVCCQAAKKKYKLRIKMFCKNEPQVGMGL